VAEIVGYALPPSAAPDSHSVLPALLAEPLAAPIREAIVHHSGEGMFSIRQGPWKLIMGLGSGGFSEPRSAEPRPGDPLGQLYRLDDDRGEARNRWAAQPEIVAHLSSLLSRYQEQGYSRPGASA